MKPSTIRLQTLQMLVRSARLRSGPYYGPQLNYFTPNRSARASNTQSRAASSFQRIFAGPSSRWTWSSVSNARNGQGKAQGTWRQIRSLQFRRHFSWRGRSLNSGGVASAAPKDETSLSARMKKLSREYGWSALGVYFLLSAADFPFFYLLVRYLGTERIGQWEHAVTSRLAVIIPESVQNKYRKARDWIKMQIFGHNDRHTLEEAETAAGKADASLATQLALAYAIHKSFIFVRVPLTAAVTPRVVKTLRSWGWDIGKRTTKAEKAAKRAEYSLKTPSKSKTK